MERKIGEIFKHQGEWYQCVEASYDEHSCLGCDGCWIEGGSCNAHDREDGKYVIFKKLEKVGKPYYDCVFRCQCQKYKLYQQDGATNRPDHCHVGTTLIYVELKQNQENMEKKNEKLSNSENIGKNLKPFDLEAAKAGKLVCTRDGRKARIVCFDRKANTPIVALIECDDRGEILQCVHNDGRCVHFDTSGNDLMMLPEKKEGWVNVYRDCDGANITENDNIYSSEEAAIASAQTINKDGYVATTKITWEE